MADWKKVFMGFGIVSLAVLFISLLVNQLGVMFFSAMANFSAIALAVIGLVAILASFAIENKVIENSVLAAGIILLTISLVWRWNDMGAWGQILASGFGLAALIAIAYFKLKGR